MEGCEFERAFRGLHSTIHNKFWISEILELKPVQELHQAWACHWTGWYFNFCRKLSLFVFASSWIHYPKAAIVVVICPLNALIYSHILELKENPRTVNTWNTKLVTREKTKPQQPTVISLWFHVAFDWLLRDGKCQNQMFYSQRTWIGYNSDIIVENRFGKILHGSAILNRRDQRVLFFASPF